MPSTYSPSLRLELQTTGENANTWGAKTNTNLNLIEQAVAGYVKITLVSASATYTLDIADASASDGRNAFIEFAGTVASAISIVVPNVEKGYWVKNSATGSNLTFRTSSGTGFTLPTNQWVFAVADGTSIVNTTPTSLTGYARLASDQTFTGLNTFTSAVAVRAALSVTGNAFVSGVTTLASAVDIKGATSLASTLLVNGNAVFNSNVSVSGTFTVSGVANLLSAVNIRGATSVGSTLVVNGAATFNSTVSVSSAVVVGPGAAGTPSISTTGDTNTGIYFPAANTLAASTAGSERMRIDSAGNVGIDTTSPAYKLDVNGAIRMPNATVIFMNDSSGVAKQTLQLFSDDNTYMSTPGALILRTNGTTERMRIDSAGRVGVATSTPSTNAILTVNGNIAVAIPTRNAASANQIGVWTSDDPVDNARAAISFATVAGGSSSSSYIAFATNNYGVSGGERMRIDSSGNVGIGTSSPSVKLQVSGGTAAITNPTTAVLLNLNDTTTNNIQLGTSGDGFYVANTANKAIWFATNNSERMRIDASGNVRIGTAALATTATDGFLYIPTCAGTPTGTPTAITGLAPLVINTTNNKLYFYSGGAWRDAGP
jgi:hypothetical protein